MRTYYARVRQKWLSRVSVVRFIVVYTFRVFAHPLVRFSYTVILYRLTLARQVIRVYSHMFSRTVYRSRARHKETKRLNKTTKILSPREAYFHVIIFEHDYWLYIYITGKTCPSIDRRRRTSVWTGGLIIVYIL